MEQAPKNNLEGSFTEEEIAQDNKEHETREERRSVEMEQKEQEGRGEVKKIIEDNIKAWQERELTLEDMREAVEQMQKDGVGDPRVVDYVMEFDMRITLEENEDGAIVPVFEKITTE